MFYFINFNNIHRIFSSKWTFSVKMKLQPLAGADIGISRGGGRIFKKMKLLSKPFFRSTDMIFWALTKTLFWPNFLRRRWNFEKKSKKAFLENADQNIAFFLPPPPPSKLVYFSAEKNYKVGQPKMDISK